MCSLEKRGSVFLLTLTGNDDHRLSPTLLDAVLAALRHVRAEATLGFALVTAAEGKFFSNGFDLNWANAGGPHCFADRFRHMGSKLRQIMAELISLPMPTVAAVTGHAAAAGFVLALAYDYIHMRKDRGLIYMSELDIGLDIPDSAMALIRSKIGAPRARRELLLRAAKMKAEEAVGMGIIDAAHDSREETVEAAVRRAEELAGRKWKGEVYASIRKATFAEVSEILGLAEKKTAVAAARL
ncbi:hypothetical protein ACLOJK_008743 [Asimina triloba]